MTIKRRIFLFVITMILLLGVFFVVTKKTKLDNDISTLLFSTLIMLSFTTFFVEHFFSSPSDVLANTTSILLAISPIRTSLDKFGGWYWLFFGYNLTFLFTSLISLLLYEKEKSESSLQNKISKFLKDISVFFGNGRFLFFVLAIMTMLFYINLQSFEMLVLFFYASIFLIINPKKQIISLASRNKKNAQDIGEIIGVQSESIFLARLYSDRPRINKLDFVIFEYEMPESQGIQAGLIIDKILLDNKQWARILISKRIDKPHINDDLAKSIKPNIVYKMQENTAEDFTDSFIGTLKEGSNINEILFEYNSRLPIHEGTLLEVEENGEKILYQVVQGSIHSEKVEVKNEIGSVIGEAVQLGVWDADNLSFSKYGWVPSMTTPVFIADDIEEHEKVDGEITLGTIPETNYPVILNIKEAVTHHTAILGVTGCGKSVLARYVIRDIIKEDFKVICVDFTNEYNEKFNDLDFKSIISLDTKKELFSAINALSDELEKWANQRDKALIAEKEEIIRSKFSTSIKNFLESDNVISAFELPDVSNSTSILEYTKRFFQILFSIARNEQNFGKKLCIVLEEAHTVIPEWTFLGVSEKKATSLVNSISQIALQGRKYNVGFVIIAQRTANVSKTVLTQCNSIIAFQQFDKTSFDFLENYMGSEAIKTLPTLQFRNAIAVGKAFRSGPPIIFQVTEIEENYGINNEQ